MCYFDHQFSSCILSVVCKTLILALFANLQALPTFCINANEGLHLVSPCEFDDFCSVDYPGNTTSLQMLLILEFQEAGWGSYIRE